MGFHSHPLAAAVALCLAGQAWADHADEEISEVFVTARAWESAAGAAVLNESDIRPMRAGTSDSAVLLGGIAGVSLYGAGGVSSMPAIRGLGDDRLRIKVDGMDLVSACANHMNPPMSYIDPTSVEAIEVMAGITPVSQGGDSIGGSILVSSTQPVFAGAGDDFIADGEIGTFYRSNGDASGGNLKASAANDWISLRYSGAYATANNYKAGDDFKAAGAAAPDRGRLAADEVGSTYYETQNQKIGVAARLDNHLVDLEVGYQHIPDQGFPNQRMDMLDNESTQIVLRHSADYNWGEVESRIFHEKTTHDMNFGDDKQFWYRDAPGMPMKTEGKNNGLAVTVEYKLSDSDLLRSGGEIQQYQLDDWWPPSGTGPMMSPNTFWNIRDGERDRYALFSEWQAGWGEQWLTLAGVRYEAVRMDSGDVQGYSPMYQADATAFNAQDHNIEDDNWDASTQAQYTPSPTQTWEIGLARKTRSPNLYERYTWSTVGMAMRMVNLAGDGNGYVGNLDLDPEVASTMSISFDWHDAQNQHWQVVVAPYITWVEDYIDATPCTAMMCNASNAIPGFRYLTFANQDARLYGVDITGFRHLGSSETLGDFSLRAVASYINGENDTTGDNLYNIMPLNATFSLEHSRRDWTNVLEWQLVSAKDNTSEVRNEVQTGGYGLLNARSSYVWHDLRMDLGVDNMFDRGYDLPLGGAYVGQGETMSPAGVPWGVTVPGMGRSVYMGLSYSF
ncbi:MAG: TonB-dependent receptor [Pseudomonadales bacterium]|nr:TonB-dependent receptor [Halioglobus sp.]MCP5194990.1 TonB-dependent receptor [Pseudomonadales bacterium]